MSYLFLLITLVAAHEANNTDDTGETRTVVYWNPFIFILFPFLFYMLVVTSSYPYVRSRFPIYLLFIAILFPPVFFGILLYLLILSLFVPIIEPTEIKNRV